MTQVDVVIPTRDRRDRLLATLEHLRGCGAGEVIVVDNASGDGTPDAVAAACPWARVVRLPENLGAAARNAGVALSAAPYVAFSGDDSWWAAERWTGRPRFSTPTGGWRCWQLESWSGPRNGSTR